MKKVIFLNVLMLFALLFTYQTKASDQVVIYLETNSGQRENITTGTKGTINIYYDSSYDDLLINIDGENRVEKSLYDYRNGWKLKVEMTGFFNIKYYEEKQGAQEFNLYGLTSKDTYFKLDGSDVFIVSNSTETKILSSRTHYHIVPVNKPGLSGRDNLILNVDNPQTIDQIKKSINLKAYDDYDGNITNKITVKEDTYTPNKNKIGEYYIVFQATNTSNLTTNYRLNIINKDLVAPKISGPTEKTIGYKQILTNEEVISFFTVTDNYDEIVNLTVHSTNYVKNKVGVYTYILKATDKSKNSSEVTLKVNVIDDVKPLITDLNEGVIKVNYKDKITDELLKLDLKATDEIDGDISGKIKVIENNIKPVLGIYKVIYEVVDKAGNKETFERSYEVISLDIPVFWVSENLLTIENVNSLNIDQILDIISLTNNIEIKEYEVTNDTYSDNKDTSGIYNISFKIIDQNNIEYNVSQDIRVFDNNDLSGNKNNNIIVLSFIVLLTTISIYYIKKKKRLDINIFK